MDLIHPCMEARPVAHSREGVARVPLGDKAKVLPVVIDGNEHSWIYVQLFRHCRVTFLGWYGKTEAFSRKLSEAQAYRERTQEPEVSLTVIKIGVKRRPSDKLWDEDQEPRATA